MSSRFDSLFDGLRQSPPVPFLSAEAIRRRGRQRARRQAVSAGVVALAVTGLGAGGLAVAVGQPDSGPPPASAPPWPGPTSPAAPVEIPQEWLLTPSDLPHAGWTETGNELFTSDPAWFWGNLCQDYRSEDYSSLRQRLDLDTVSWINNESVLQQVRLDQVVELFDGTLSAAINVEDVRSVIDRCTWSPTDGDEVAGSGFEVVDEDLAGDQSLLIEIQEYAYDGETFAPVPHQRLAVVIRVGGAVATLISDDEGLLRSLALRAADLLS